MAKITDESRKLFNSKIKPYQDAIDKSLAKEKDILNLISKDSSGTAFKKYSLSEEMVYVATLYMTINNLSVEFLEMKNSDALNNARKTLYKAIIYLEEVVTKYIDAPYSEYEKNVNEIASVSLQKRYFSVRKMGLAIRLLKDSFGDNSKWTLSFVELSARYATVAKNLIDLREAGKVFNNPQDKNYDTTVFYLRLIKRLLSESADQYRDKYELSTHRADDMKDAIKYLSALRRLHIIMNEPEEADEVKKKATVWKEKLDTDIKKGITK